MTHSSASLTGSTLCDPIPPIPIPIPTPPRRTDLGEGLEEEEVVAAEPEGGPDPRRRHLLRPQSPRLPARPAHPRGASIIKEGGEEGTQGMGGGMTRPGLLYAIRRARSPLPLNAPLPPPSPPPTPSPTVNVWHVPSRGARWTKNTGRGFGEIQP